MIKILLFNLNIFFQDPYAENFEEESMAEFRKKNTKKPRERKPK